MGDNDMADTPSQGVSASDVGSPEHTSPIKKQHQRKMSETMESTNASPSPEPDDGDSKPTMPMQKRRRVTRACDECRRKKIKCDGKQPCTHCTVYSYECTYDQPSNRRRNPAPQYIEALEQRLQKAEAILRAVLPGMDIDDPKLDAHAVDQLIAAARANQPARQNANVKPEDDAGMHSMLDQTGSLDLDDTGHWDYHGHTSGYMFMSRFRAKFGTAGPATPHNAPDNKNLSHVVESPKSIHSSPFDANGTLHTDLPPREIALEYCRAAIDDGCALTRPLHRPTFFNRLNSIYDTDPEQWNNEHMRFLPLLYSVLALGCLFAQDSARPVPDSNNYQNALEQGYHWFHASKSMLDITDCRDLLSLQTVIFMILFLQGSAKLATCYSYIGIALRGCCRLGMHRKVNTRFNIIEQEERKRCFWLVRKLDTYVGTMLGLPHMLATEDIDQELPIEVHDNYIKEDGVSTPRSNEFPLMRATNSHTKLLFIMKKVLRYVYPLNAPTQQTGQANIISHSRIRELERDLQTWMDQLPIELRPSSDAKPELSRVQQLLRMSYAYVQMMMYRPFLHYVSSACQTGTTDKRSFACAAACVSVARNIVHITSEMRRRGLLNGAYWFVMYITYFAILSLVYFVLENPESAASKDILNDAREGRETLASLAKRSFAADRCTSSLNGLFEELPDKLKERRMSLQATSTASRKRSQPSADPVAAQHNNAPGGMRSTSGALSSSFGPSNRAQTVSNEYLNRISARGSLPNSPSTTSASFNMGPEGRSSILGNSSFTTPQANSPSVPQLDWSVPQLQQGNFPDLKNVMFPSDNPFAYGNQAISTLEDSSFGGLQDVAYGSEPFGSTSESQYSSPAGAHARGRSDYNMGSLSAVGGGDQFSQQQQQQQGRGFDTQGGGRSMYGMTGNEMVEEPGSMHQQQQMQQGQSEDYWNNKGPFTGRTGFTPGGHGVNLDELFGGGNGWGPMNMGMDNMNFGAGPNQGNAGQQGGMSGMWPSQNVNWQ